MDSTHPTTPPRAQGLPLVGVLPRLLRGQYRYLEHLAGELGPIFELDLGLMKALVVGDAEAAEEIFVKRGRNYDKGGDFWDGARDLLGSGLGASEGELWQRQHKLMVPNFRRSVIEGYAPMIDATVRDALDGLPADTPVDISRWCDELLSMLTVRILLGSDSPPEQIRGAREAMSTLFATVLPEMVLGRLPRWLPRPGRAKLGQARAKVEEILSALIADKRARGPGDDLLSALVHAADEQGVMSDEQLRDEAVFIYTAGYETTGVSLGWTLWLLARHPALLAALQAELDSGAAERPTLQASVREGLRLYPPGAIIPRRAVADDELCGLAVEADTIVLVCPWLIHRDRRWWPQPERFDPSRFSDPESHPPRPRLAWSPFGAGQRVCLGQGLALLELERALAEILTRYTPRLVDDGPAPRARMSTTLHPDRPIMLTMTPR